MNVEWCLHNELNRLSDNLFESRVALKVNEPRTICRERKLQRIREN